MGWDQRHRKSLRIWIEGIWAALGGASTLCSTTELEQCQQYLDLLEQQETGGTINDWPAFEKAVQSLYAKPDQDADPNLHVMTIHKAKGLEFDTVIIPGLNRKPRGDDKQLMLWQERVSQQGQNQLIIGPLEQTGLDADPLYKYLQREHQLKGQLEKARVLYVATTRAISKTTSASTPLLRRKSLPLTACLKAYGQYLNRPLKLKHRVSSVTITLWMGMA